MGGGECGGKGRTVQQCATAEESRRGVGMHASVLTFKALLTSTPVSVHQIVTSASILAWVRETLISVHFAVDADPACITEALVSGRQNYFRRGMNARLRQS